MHFKLSTMSPNTCHPCLLSKQGIEWGYGGSGPADLALSVLHRVTDPTCAEALYQRFKAEVVASVPHAGGFIRAADVRAWIAAQTDR